MIGRTLFLCFVTLTTAFSNPYKEVSSEEKINIFTNYFLNMKVQEELPKKPEKQKADTGKYNYNATKYELNYNYVQRLKAIKESIAEEQGKYNDQYNAEIYKYYNKLEKLYKKYQNKEHRLLGVQESFNKALKTVYGKPVVRVKEVEGLKRFYLDVDNIYNLHEFTPKEVKFGVVAKTKLLPVYDQCELNVVFKYENEDIIYDEVSCKYKERVYIGEIVDQGSEKVKLKIKINDDIFQKILKDRN